MILIDLCRKYALEKSVHIVLGHTMFLDDDDDEDDDDDHRQDEDDDDEDNGYDFNDAHADHAADRAADDDHDAGDAGQKLKRSAAPAAAATSRLGPSGRRRPGVPGAP